MSNSESFSEKTNKYLIKLKEIWQTKKVPILFSFVILILLITLIYLYKAIDNHFISYLNGFWTSNTIDGQCILYFDGSTIQINELDELTESTIENKYLYDLKSISHFDLLMRTYTIKLCNPISKSDLTSNISNLLNNKKLFMDLYPIEGTCIIYDNDGDILTLIKDNETNISLIKS